MEVSNAREIANDRESAAATGTITDYKINPGAEKNLTFTTVKS